MCDCEIEYLCYFSVSNNVSANQLMLIQGVLLIRDRLIDVSEHRVILWKKRKENKKGFD